jgi:hypothetical protein
MALYLNADPEFEGMFDTLDPDNLVLVALVAEEAWMQFTGGARDAIWEQLVTPDATFPSEMVDRGITLLSSLDLAVATLSLVAAATGKSAAERCQIWALGIAGGMGVDPD